MECKLSPTVSVESVWLEEWPYVKVSVVISDVFSTFLKDEELSKYIRAVCILSIYDPSSRAMLVPPEAWLETNKHWGDIEWYTSLGWDEFLRAEKVFPTNDTVFELNIESLIDPTDDVETTKKNWSTAYLSYFTYIQVDTQQMAEDFNITIADEYKGMAGDYETGVIMIGGVVVDADARSFDVQDLREAVEEEPVDDACGAEYDPSQATEGETTDVDTPGDFKTAPKINTTFGTLSKVEREDNIDEGDVESNTMGEKQ
jgi:hypothetical protein